MRLIDLTGKRFSRLLVLKREKKPGRRTFWLCLCDCGKEKAINGDALQRGLTSSCGCMASEMISARSTTHGHLSGYKRSREYRSWSHAKGRCYNPTDHKFPHYGGRGIQMCQEWLNDFSAFFCDMGFSPPGTSLDRIDVNGNYEPSNCRWATPAMQARNSRQCIYVVFNGTTMTLKEASRAAGVNYKALHFRYRKMKLNINDAIASAARSLGTS